MKPVFEFTKGMREMTTSYCPGCTHGIAHRLIMEVLEEKGALGNAIGVSPVGCSIVAHQFMNVFTYQGDGDLASIGTGEIIHAAHRGEKFCTFFINNAIFGMTGGQMAPTSLIGQKTTTSVEGRTVEQAGAPLRISEMLATIDGAVYVERVSLHSPAEVRKAKKAIRTAFEVQEKKLGFAFVEFLSTCPTNWGLSPVAALDFIKDKMIPYYPVKNFKSVEEVK